jgi:hypothetical protein
VQAAFNWVGFIFQIILAVMLSLILGGIGFVGTLIASIPLFKWIG